MSKSRLLARALEVTTIALTVFLCLFGNSSLPGIGDASASLVQDLMIIFRDSGTQWMVFLCVSIYFSTFLLLQYRHLPQRFRHLDNPKLWLTVALAVGTLAYAVNYSAAWKSTQALTLMAAAALGLGAGVGLRWRISRTGLLVLIPATLIIFLLTASLWWSDTARIYEYRGHSRWSGPWDNPNMFGLLMGTGVALAAGGAVSSFRFRVLSSPKDCRRTIRVGRWAISSFCFVAVCLMGRGLLHSYSRGAWLATLYGVVFLAGNLKHGNTPLTPNLSPRAPGGEGELLSSARRISRLSGWLRSNWLPFFIILFSVTVLAFWQFRQTEWHPARRAFSVGNRNDSSWRNRLAAWEGTLQMMAEKPWFGFGWNQPEPMYEHFYLPPKLTDSAAIQMNDYFLLGATLGIPALFCFGAYLWLSLRSGAPLQYRAESEQSVSGTQGTDAPYQFLPIVCRAGAIVLLVGFWFDGGLFKLPTASTFWILLELGRTKKEMERTEKQSLGA